MVTMNKLDKLLHRINEFCTQALCSFLLVKKAAEPQSYYMPDDPEDDSLPTSGSLLDRAENFDIKDEELFNQFERFMAAYKELIDSLTIDAKNLTSDSFEKAGQLIDTLNTRYKRIITNPYLNVSEEEGFDEDFDPGELTKFIQEVVSDAERQLKEAAGQDVDMDEVRANQYAQEFNDNRNLDRGDPNVRWTGDKVRQNMEAKKEYFNKLMFIKKVGKSHPDYEKYENYIQNRRRSYQNIVSDPERRTGYRAKAKNRIKDFRKKLLIRKNELEQMLSQTNDPQKIFEIRQALQELSTKYRGEKAVEVAQKIKEVKQSGSLTGLVIHLQQKLASLKKDAATSIKNKAKKDPAFNPYKKAVQVAKENFDRDPSPTNQNALQVAIRSETEAIQNYLNGHPITNKIREDLVGLYALRDKLKIIDEQGWIGETVVDEVKPALHQTVGEVESLAAAHEKNYKGVVATLREISQLLKSKL
jgi:hypothetical protein